jgi:hypothetical protein
MTPRAPVAGVAGIAAGVGLAVEFGLFMAGGWTPASFETGEAALALFASGGTALRAAGAVGIANLALWLLLLGGLAGALKQAAPSCAAGALWFGLVGAAAHALVPMGLWTGIPVFLGMATEDPSSALGAWPAYSIVQAAATGAGYLFAGAALIAIATGLLTARVPARALAWTAGLGGAAALVSVLGTATPLAPVAEIVFLPGLLLTVVFRVWAGHALWRGRLHARGSVAA